jgi:hypothetical protein
MRGARCGRRTRRGGGPVPLPTGGRRRPAVSPGGPGAAVAAPAGTGRATGPAGTVLCRRPRLRRRWRAACRRRRRQGGRSRPGSRVPASPSLRSRRRPGRPLRLRRCRRSPRRHRPRLRSRHRPSRRPRLPREAPVRSWIIRSWFRNRSGCRGVRGWAGCRRRCGPEPGRRAGRVRRGSAGPVRTAGRAADDLRRACGFPAGLLQGPVGAYGGRSFDPICPAPRRARRVARTLLCRGGPHRGGHDAKTRS